MNEYSINEPLQETADEDIEDVRDRILDDYDEDTRSDKEIKRNHSKSRTGRPNAWWE